MPPAWDKWSDRIKAGEKIMPGALYKNGEALQWATKKLKG